MMMTMMILFVPRTTFFSFFKEEAAYNKPILKVVVSDLNVTPLDRTGYLYLTSQTRLCKTDRLKTSLNTNSVQVFCFLLFVCFVFVFSKFTLKSQVGFLYSSRLLFGGGGG